MRKNVLLVVGALSTAALNADLAWAQATRTWVSGVGDDANPCSRTAPCKTFAGAISKTATGGEINCLDPGGFGALTITKSIAILCEFTEGGVLAAGTNGINVNTPAGSIVMLRGLDIQGVGSGLSGINFIQAGVLHVEKCIIRGFNSGAALGVNFAPTNASELYVSDSYISDNGTGIQIKGTGSVPVNAILNRVEVNNNVTGIRLDGTANTNAMNLTVTSSAVSGSSSGGITSVSPAGGAALKLAITNSLIASNVGSGVNSNGAAGSGTGSSRVLIGGSTITANQIGVSITGLGAMQSFKNNIIAGNGTDGTPLGAFSGPGGTPLQ